MVLRCSHQRAARSGRAGPGLKEARLVVQLLVERGRIHDELRVLNGNGCLGRRALGPDGDGLVNHIDASSNHPALGFASEGLFLVVDHGELLAGVQFLDLVPAQGNIAEDIAVECDLAGDLADKGAVQRVAVREHQDIRRRGRLGLRRAED